MLSDVPSSKTRFWKLYVSLLQTPEVLEEVGKELNFYFQTNDNPECDPGTIWEAHKTVIRGILLLTWVADQETM